MLARKQAAQAALPATAQGADGELHDFDPQSDFAFVDMRARLLAELADARSRPSTPGAPASAFCHVAKASPLPGRS